MLSQLTVICGLVASLGGVSLSEINDFPAAPQESFSLTDRLGSGLARVRGGEGGGEGGGTSTMFCCFRMISALESETLLRTPTEGKELEG
jgi:hypothetical protein